MTSLRLPSGLAIDDPERRMLRFCAKEYPDYDGVRYGHPDRIEPVDVLVTIMMNSWVAHTDKHRPNAADNIRAIQRGLAANCDPILSEIPDDVDISTFDPDCRVFRRLIAAATRVLYVGVAVATKVLHRKRRGWIPMLDSVVVKHYAISAGLEQLLDEAGRDKRRAVDLAVECQKLFREDLRACRGEVGSLGRALADAGYPLTDVRLLEVLVWTEVEPNGYYRRTGA